MSELKKCDRPDRSVKSIRILGCGNPLMGDDGVGIRVIGELKKTHLNDMGGVEIIDAGVCGLDLLNLFEGADKVIIVDAVVSGGGSGCEIGSIHRFSGDELKEGGLQEIFSVHDIGISDVLNIGEHVQKMPDVVVFGIEIQMKYELSMELTKNALDAVEVAIGMVLDEVLKGS